MKLKGSHGIAGQTLVEWLVSCFLIVGTLSFAFQVFQSGWNRARCAYLVFETTHASLSDRRLPKSKTWVSVEEREDSFRGRATCGETEEVVVLPKLEAIVWD